MIAEPVLLARERSVTRLTLNRPERLNALTADLHAGMRDALDAVEADQDCRCLILTGSGRGFCVGQDLTERVVSAGATPKNIGEHLDHDLHPLVNRLRDLPFPVIAAVNGVAAGAGASLALAADLVFASRSAMFIFAFAKIGLGPDGGSSWSLPRLIGPARAAGLLLLAEPLSAEQAQAWGLIWACVDDDALTGIVGEVAERLSAHSRSAIAETKRTLAATWGNDFHTQMTLERNIQEQLGFGSDYREGVAAFLEKRPARFGVSG